jgi:short-subunit dehydrogenase
MHARRGRDGARLGPISILVNNAGDGDASDGRAWKIARAAACCRFP